LPVRALRPSRKEKKTYAELVLLAQSRFTRHDLLRSVARFAYNIHVRAFLKEYI